jgi:pimeloyl-ACP methyl ester carboxylesterase
MPSYVKGTVRSADGTTIGYRQYGTGPGLIVVHGGMKAGQHFSVLATELSDRFRVYVPDRRGRGLSGPHDPDHVLQREVEDMQALVAATDARFIFGHSSGALVSLRAALSVPRLQRVALYEPPLPVRGSVPTDWLPRFDREIAAGRRAAAASTALKGTRLEPTFTWLPRWLLTGVVAVGLRAQKPSDDEASIADLIPTMHFDVEIVREMADTAREYAALQLPILLLSGTESPDYFGIALRELAAVLPHAQLATLPRLDHSGPEDGGSPVMTAQILRDFFASAA